MLRQKMLPSGSLFVNMVHSAFGVFTPVVSE